MENLTNSSSDQEMIQLNNESLKQLAETRKWTTFLSIVGFVFLGLILLMTIILIGFGNAFSGSGTSFLTLVPLILLGFIYFFPIYYLFQFSSYSKQALNKTESELLSKALRYLKMHYRFMGIFIITLLSLYLILFIILIISGNPMNFFQH